MFFCTAVIVESEGKGIDSQMTKCLFYCQILFPPPKLKEVKKKRRNKEKETETEKRQIRVGISHGKPRGPRGNFQTDET